MGYKLQVLDDNLLHLKFVGDIELEDVVDYLEEYAEYLNTVTAERPLHTVIDVSNVKRASAAVRKEFGEIFRDADPRAGKSAMVGANRYIRVLSGFVIKATGTKKLRLFEREEDALSWLKEGQS
jgi:hypothetical protein